MKRLIYMCLCLSFSACIDGVLFGPPVVGSVSIAPEPATANDVLECVYDGFKGGEDASTIAWEINGESAGSGDTLDGGYVLGDEVRCTVTPSNGNKTGDPVSATATIENALPIMDSVTLTPSIPTSSDKLTCNHTGATDVDGTTSFTYNFGWTLNGDRLSASGDTLNASDIARDDVVQCHVSANDGESDGVELDSQEVDVQNSVPTVTGAAIDPPSPLVDDTLYCDYDTFVDADDDPDKSTISWTINAVAAGSGTSLGSGYEKGDVVKCKITPYDGIEEGTPVWIGVTIIGPEDCDDDGDGYWKSSYAAFECDVLEETNYYRSIGYDCDTRGKFGATTPLEMQHQLRRAARYHSKWMADTGTFSHDSPGGPHGDDFVERIESAGYSGWSLVGENIAAGYSTPEEAVLGWMKSDGHCANIMNSQYNEIGIGYHYDSGSSYKHWWSQEFGKR